MRKYLWRKYYKEFIFTGILLAGFIALLSRIDAAGFVLIIGGILLYLYLKFKPAQSNEIKQLKQQLENQRHEIADLKNRQLNVGGHKPILEVSLLEIDTNFTRTWNEKFVENETDLHFIGALQIHLIAKYGVNLQDLKVKIDHNRKQIQVANLQPKFLSFGAVNHDWKIAELMEHKKRPWIISNYWKKSDQFQSFLTKKMEEKRHAVYEEIKQGPEEIQWLLKPVYQQMENTVRILLNRTDYEVVFTEQVNEDFIPIEQFFDRPLIAEKQEKLT